MEAGSDASQRVERTVEQTAKENPIHATACSLQKPRESTIDRVFLEPILRGRRVVGRHNRDSAFDLLLPSVNGVSQTNILRPPYSGATGRKRNDISDWSYL